MPSPDGDGDDEADRPDPRRARVFGIGLNKTATTSFHAAMTILGYDSLHWGGPPIRKEVERALADGVPLLSYLDQRHDAFSDIEPITRNFALLDRQYPGSTFVLTVRPVEDWLDSRRRHVENNVRRKALGEYHGAFLEVDEPAWRAEWDDHLGQVRRHFAGRDDFLEVDFTSGEGWGPLCQVLGVPEPEAEFPGENSGRRVRPAAAPEEAP
jgi:hypothetical protein